VTAVAYLALLERLLCLLALRYVYHDTPPELRTALPVAYEHRFVPDPDNLTTASDHTVLQSQRLTGRVGPLFFSDHALAVVGVEQPVPESGIFSALFYGVAQKRLDLRAYVRAVGGFF
jgi:hypothetical protein